MKPVGRQSAVLLAAAAAAAAFSASCRTTATPRKLRTPVPSSTFLEPRLPEAPGAGPALRIGILTDAQRVTVAAQGEVLIWGGSRERPTRAMRASFAPVSSAGAADPGYRIQVASLSDPTAAKTAAERIREISGLPPTVRWNAETRTYQVRVGEYKTREQAAAEVARLIPLGWNGLWVVADEPAPTAGQLRLVETGESMVAATVTPSVEGESLVVDNTTYRGFIEVRPNDAGTLTVINIAPVEDYLRGVVPNELSPQSFPQIEALKAQAVAARTYALRNRGQFRAKGFDICATPACQVYRGQSSEDPLSDQAVAQTRGIVASSNGEYINALYTSTCGGHTEDAANIFEGNQGAAYLKGVVCAPERSAWATIRTALPPTSISDEPGLDRDAALLMALNVVSARDDALLHLKGLAREAEVRDWVSRLRTAVGRQGCEARVDPPLNRRGTFFHFLVDSLCWDERGRRLLAPQDPDYLLQVEDRNELKGEEEQMAVALLLHEGILAPFPDNTLRPGIGLTRAQAISLMARVVEKVGAPEFSSAEFRSAVAGDLTVKLREASLTVPLDPRMRLYRVFDQSRVAASEVTLSAGDRVSYVLRDGRVTFLEAIQSRLGAAADRTSRYYRWEVRLTPAEVEQAVAKYGKAGTVRDVVPVRPGVSGRVVELVVAGSLGEVALTGLRIRSALGLRENLFVVERESDAAGKILRFVFIGKGWGHGVGMCQVGAYGMALAGADFETILKHYYTGIRLDRAY